MLTSAGESAEPPHQARPSPFGFQDQGRCAGGREEEVQGSFWYQGRKTLWEEVVCRGDTFCSAGENVLYSDAAVTAT